VRTAERLRPAMGRSVRHRHGLWPRVLLLPRPDGVQLREGPGRQPAPVCHRHDHPVQRGTRAALSGPARFGLSHPSPLRGGHHVHRDQDEQVRGPANRHVQRRCGLPVDVDVRVPDDLRRAAYASGNTRSRRRMHAGLHPSKFGPGGRGLRWRRRGPTVGRRRLGASTIVARSVRQRSQRHSGGGIARDSRFVERARGLPDGFRRDERELGAHQRRASRGGSMEASKKASSDPRRVTGSAGSQS
jgi:hypothetical protein